jgi:putative spermidine/putrescine transport system substrate-binding protein
MKHNVMAGKSLLILLVIFALVFGILAVSSAEQRFDGVTLRFGTWGGPWKKIFEEGIQPKFEALGGKLVFATGSPPANFAKVIAARGDAPFDIMEILDAQEKEVLKSGFLQKLDLSKIPNVKYLDANQYDENWASPWTTQEIICYNVPKFKELGLSPPGTYQDLNHAELRGRIMIPELTSGAGFANFGGLVYAAGGDENNIQPGFELIKELDINKFWTRGGQAVTEFQTGDIYAALMHCGWCLRTKRAGAPVAAVAAKLNDQYTGVHKTGRIGLMKSTKDPKVIEAAHWWINEYLSAEFQYLFATRQAVVPVNKLALKKIGEEPELSQFIVTDPEKIRKFLVLDYQKVDVPKWIDTWNRWISK